MANSETTSAPRLSRHLWIGALLGLCTAAVVGFSALASLWWVGAGPNLPQPWSAWDYLGLLAWPTPWLLSVGDDEIAELSNLMPLTLAVVSNMVLYSVVAALVWLARRQSWVVLLAPALLLAAVWYAAWPR